MKQKEKEADTDTVPASFDYRRTNYTLAVDPDGHFINTAVCPSVIGDQLQSLFFKDGLRVLTIKCCAIILLLSFTCYGDYVHTTKEVGVESNLEVSLFAKMNQMQIFAVVGLLHPIHNGPAGDGNNIDIITD